jgi:predicted DNA-binding ribbon-helix-helix protein
LSAASPYHPPVKYSVTIKGHQTSISLEPLFWDMLRAAAAELSLPLNELVAQIDNERLASSTPSGLAGAIRIWLTIRTVEKESAAPL